MSIRNALKMSRPDEYPDGFVDYILSDLVYLAGPYMHPDPAVREARFLQLTAIAAELMQDNVQVYSPITHNHPIAINHSMPREWDFWKKFDLPMLKRCRLLIVVKLEGWERSVGVRAEINFATENGIHVVYFSP